MNKEIIIEFHKRFANGEQYLVFTEDGKIEEEEKNIIGKRKAFTIIFNL